MNLLAYLDQGAGHGGVAIGVIVAMVVTAVVVIATIVLLVRRGRCAPVALPTQSL